MEEMKEGREGKEGNWLLYFNFSVQWTKCVFTVDTSCLEVCAHGDMTRPANEQSITSHGFILLVRTL